MWHGTSSDPLRGSRQGQAGVPTLALTGLLLLITSAACTKTLTAQTVLPNPAVFTDVTPQSSKLHIDVRDMDLPRTFTLRQSASFAMVNRERLRFHVTLVHKWQEIADPTTWNVHLVDDLGRVYYPETQEKRYDDHVTRMWDWEQRTAARNEYGDILPNGLRNDGWQRPQFLDSIDVFQGAGDYVFHANEILNRGVKSLTLIMSRSGMEYQFIWHLANHREEAVFMEEPRE